MILLFTFFVSLAHGQTHCSSSWMQKGQSKDVSQLLRGNTIHYWTWIGSNQGALGTWKTYQGMVVGDPHLNNFGFVVNSEKVHFTVSDIDDVGKGPYIADVARFVLMAEVETDRDIKKQDILDSYLEGLKGIVWEKKYIPTTLYSTLELKKTGIADRKESELERLLEFSKNVPKIRRNEKRKNITTDDYKDLVSTMTPKFKDLFQLDKILDVVEVVNERGGCPECKRYLVLASNDKSKELMDMKEIRGAAPYCSLQQDPDLTKKLKDLKVTIADLWGGSLSRAAVLTFKDMSFLVRPKQWEGMDFSGKKKDQLELASVLKYEAYTLGRIHAAMGSTTAYKNKIEANRKDFHDRVESLVRGYYDLIPSGY